MKTQMKKALSLVLAMTMLMGILSLSFPVLAIGDVDVTFDAQGGELADGVKTDYNAGEALPGYESVERTGFAFAGWYDNDKYAGSPHYFVPDGASGSVTYYAKWILCEVTGDNFESYTDTAVVTVDADGKQLKTTDMINSGDLNLCYYWTGDTDGSAALNTDAAHAYSGSKSVKLFVPQKKDGNASWRNKTQFAIPNHSLDGDGAYFWIETSTAATITVMFQYQAVKSAAIPLPAGKHLIAVPWSTLSGAMYGKQMLVEISHGAEDNTVYLDDFGTYEDIASPGASSDVGIRFELGGGSFSDYTAPTEYFPKMPLPTYENVVLEGHAFAGWYDNAGFEGMPVFYVPGDAVGDQVYYARWVDCTADFDTFESYTGKEAQDLNNFWASWTYSGEISLNTAAKNAYNGSKSLQVAVKNRSAFGDDRADLVLSRELRRTGDGLYFWIQTEVATQVWLRLNYSASFAGYTTAKISIPEGKNLVMIPWSEVPGADERNYWWMVELNVETPTLPGTENTVYIDDIGSFADSIENALTFDLNGGVFANGYTAPLGYFTSAGLALPTYENVENDGYTLMGWYENADLTGNPVTVIPAGTTGAKTYHAKWVVRDVTFDNFDGTVKTWGDWTGTNSLSAPYYDAAHANSGTKSLKYTVPNQWAAVYTQDAFAVKGDGICFWIDAPQELTVKIAVNYTTSFPEITVPAGKSYVFAPWSSFGSAIEGRDTIEIFLLYITAPNGTVLYLDDVGTYTSDISAAYGIRYETYGGEFVTGYTAPTKYCAGGVLLPEGEFITRQNSIFKGWYASPDFSGSPVSAVPADATGEKTYYAKWVMTKTITYDFDTTGLNTPNSVWSDWVVGDRLTLNQDPSHAHSGSCSAKYAIPAAPYPFANLFASDSLMVDGDGVCFWIETDHPITLYLRFSQKDANTSSDVTVPAGKSVVTIPWSDIKNAPADGQWAGNLQIMTRNVAEATTFYIDDVGTYTENARYSLTYNIGDAAWVDSYTPDAEYSANGYVLPNYEKIKNNANPEATLVGWCEKQDLSDEALRAIPAGTVGDKVLYPKWEVHVADYDNFDGYANDEDLAGVWENANASVAQMSLNSDAAHLHYGQHSMRLAVKKYASKAAYTDFLNRNLTLAKAGDGIILWVEASYPTTLKIRVNYETSSKPGVTSNEKYVPAGKSVITVPWSQIGNAAIKRLELLFRVPADSGTNAIYVDSIGTYYADVDQMIHYNLNGGSFVDERLVNRKCSPLDSVVLPTFENVRREGFCFAGWYDNEAFTGAPLYLLAPGANGKALYAKWVEQESLNHTFDNYASTKALQNDYWKEYTEAYEGWREHGGAELTLNTDAANTAPGSSKSLQAKYCVPGGGYVDGGEAPAALFGRYYWETTFGTRGANKEGDGIRFWIKSDRTVTLAAVFNKQGKNRTHYMPKITVPANVPVTVYLPWTALSNNGADVYELFYASFEIFDAIGAAGTVWIDDLGVYYEEKVVDFVRENEDGDIRVMGYNNHIPKDTVVQIDKHPASYLQQLGGKAPAGATVHYIADYKLLNPTGGTADLTGPAWVSFKLPSGVDVGKLGVYELFFDGSRTAVNYTVEGEWITVYVIEPVGTLMLTANDSEWAPKGPSIEEGAVQPLKVTVTTTVTSEVESASDETIEAPDDTDATVSDDNDAEEPEEEDGDKQSGGAKRPPKREPLQNTGNNADEAGFPWVVIAAICAGVLVLAAGIFVLVAVKRRGKKAGGAK